MPKNLIEKFFTVENQPNNNKNEKKKHCANLSHKYELFNSIVIYTFMKLNGFRPIHPRTLQHNNKCCRVYGVSTVSIKTINLLYFFIFYIKYIFWLERIY